MPCPAPRRPPGPRTARRESPRTGSPGACGPPGRLARRRGSRAGRWPRTRAPWPRRAGPRPARARRAGSRPRRTRGPGAPRTPTPGTCSPGPPSTWRSALRPAALDWRRACLVLWQAEHALADDVALDLTGAARDGVLPRAQDAVVPARAVGDLLARPVHERVRAKQLAHEVRDAHPQLRAEELEDGALGPGRLTAELPGQVAHARVALALRLDHELGEALANDRMLPRGAPVELHPGGQDAQPGQLLLVAAAAAVLALVHEGGHRGLPALVLSTDQVGLRDLHVHEEHLVEVAVAVQQHEGAHRDAGGRHVHQQVADAAMLGRARVGAHEQVDPVRELRARRPHLLAVHHEVVPPLLRPRAEAREVGARARLGVALAPDVVAAQDARQVALLLRLGAPFDDGGPRHADAGVAGQHRGARPEALLVVDDLLHQGGPASAVRFRPRDADPARGEHPALPCAPALERLAVRRHPLVGRVLDAQVVGEVGGEPAADLPAELLLLRREGEIHAPLLAPVRPRLKAC